MWRNAWGKILGAFFGFSIAGPVGALFGILIGNIFDKGLGITQTASSYVPRGQTRKVFNYTTFAVMGHIAKADGRVSEREIDIARKMMESLNLNSTETREAMDSFSQGKSSSFQLGLVLTELRFACRQQPSLLKSFVEIQYNAVVSGNNNIQNIDIRKQKAVNSVFEQLGFIPMFRTYSYQDWQKSQYSSYQHQAQPRVNELALAYETLAISEQATAAEIKKAYRKKMSLHHPDKLIAKGLSDKEVKAATEKAQKIQAAYEKIRQARGF